MLLLSYLLVNIFYGISDHLRNIFFNKKKTVAKDYYTLHLHDIVLNERTRLQRYVCCQKLFGV